jgi:hypothetical protein
VPDVELPLPFKFLPCALAAKKYQFVNRSGPTLNFLCCQRQKMVRERGFFHRYNPETQRADFAELVAQDLAYYGSRTEQADGGAEGLNSIPANKHT